MKNVRPSRRRSRGLKVDEADLRLGRINRRAPREEDMARLHVTMGDPMRVEPIVHLTDVLPDRQRRLRTHDFTFPRPSSFLRPWLLPYPPLR